MADDLLHRTSRLAADDWPAPPPGRRRALAARLDDASVAVAARTGVAPRAVVGLLVVALVVAGVLGARLVLARTRAAPTPLAPVSSTATPGQGAATMTAASPAPAAGLATAPTGPVPGSASATPGSSASPVVVHVVGQVRHAGVVRLAPGARIEDALRAAGGATRRADLAAVNLARLAVDGEQVVVPSPGQHTAAVTGSVAPGSGQGTAAGSGSGHVVDLNAATPEQLDELPGVGPVLAGRIVDWRAEHGRFSSVDELSEISGIGDKVMERLRALVRV